MTKCIQFCAAVLALGCVSTHAAITISRDTAWGPDSVKIADNVTVDSGATLTVVPASRMVFNNNCGMLVLGRLLAVGTASDSITFSAVSGSNVSWNGIHFTKTPWANDTSKLFYCAVDHAGWSMMSPGGIAADSFSRLIIAHSTVANNGGFGGLITGGGIYLRLSNPIIANVRIVNNHADGSLSNGGGLYCDNANPLIVNTLFWGNSSSGAAAGGGAVYCRASSPTLVNCTIVNNQAVGAATFGGGIYCQFGSCPHIINCIIWGNQDDQAPVTDTFSAPLFKNCDVQPGSYLVANAKAAYQKCMDLDPRFANDSAGDFSLTGNSPCVNMGTADTSGLGLPALDLADNPRVFGSRVDIGAYEFQGAHGGPVVTVLSPHGGEVWTAGSTQSVTWSVLDNATITCRSIWLSTDNGAHFSKIDSAASGQFAWTIPVTLSSSKCLIGVIAYDNNGVTGWGESDSTFTILGELGVAHKPLPSDEKGPGNLAIAAGKPGIEFHVECTGPGGFSIQVFDARGRTVWRYREPEVSHEMHTVVLPYEKVLGCGVLFAEYEIGEIHGAQRLIMVR